ncbi:hypothetical protein ABPG72_021411 [Tetrahymena utriculariae]
MSHNQFFAFDETYQQFSSDQNHSSYNFSHQQEQRKLKSTEKEIFGSKIKVESSTNSNQDQSTNSGTDQKNQSNKNDDSQNNEFPELFEDPVKKESKQVDLSCSDDKSLDILSFSWNLAKILNDKDDEELRLTFYSQIFFEYNEDEQQRINEGMLVHNYYEKLGKLLQDVPLLWLGELYFDIKKNFKNFNIEDLNDENQFNQRIDENFNDLIIDIIQAKELYQNFKKNGTFKNFNIMNQEILTNCNLNQDQLQWILFIYFQLHLHYNKTKKLTKITIEEKHSFFKINKRTDLIFYNDEETEYLIVDFKYSQREVDQILSDYFKKDSSKDHFIDQIKAVQSSKKCNNVKLIIIPIKNKFTSYKNYKEYDLNELQNHQQQFFQKQTNKIVIQNKELSKNEKETMNNQIVQKIKAIRKQNKK